MKTQTQQQPKKKQREEMLWSDSQENKNENISERDDEIRSLVDERRNIAKGEKHELKELSKRIKKCTRERKRAKRQEKIQQILEEFRGIKSGRERALIPKVKNDKCETITSRKGIANIFGEFYSKLYAETQLGEEAKQSQNMETRMNNEKKTCSEDVKNEIPEFTQEEVQAAIDKQKK